MDDDDPNFDWNDKGDIKNNFFTIDFTLEELATLKRKQVNYFIDPNFNWQYSFATFDEFVTIAQSKNVGIAPEIKSPTAINKVYTLVYTIYYEHNT
jgi:glycerophosphoryl diester phosphodiesterase